MVLKRDSVNRVQGKVRLRMDGSSFYKGQRVTLTKVDERDIDPVVRDAMAMDEPRIGDSYGDAVFDSTVCYALGLGSDALGLPEENAVLGIIGDAPNVCDAMGLQATDA